MDIDKLKSQAYDLIIEVEKLEIRKRELMTKINHLGQIISKESSKKEEVNE